VNPLDALYAAAARRRRRRYARRPDLVRRLSRPVVSVGNLTVGGSGKTPVAALVARLLLDAGERPSILSRGYSRTQPEDGVTVVSDGRRVMADVGRAGDEPLLLARTLPGVRVVVSADRYLAGVLAECHLDATVHVLDDGFQHFQLHRQANLLIVEPEDVRQPRLLPRGRLREPLDAAAAADAILVPPETDAAGLGARLGVTAAFTLVRALDQAIEAGTDRPVTVPPGTRVVTMCGIARPRRFIDETSGGGYEVADSLIFSDHHPYTNEDLRRAASRALTAGAELILVTEKDLVRLLPLRPWPVRIAVRPMAVSVEPADAFAEWLLTRIRPGRRIAGDAA
jgi:tetraacyldisaccharide 4'-kinase